MNIINHNPYRIAGILSNATTREIERQKGRVKAYSKVGKEIKSDYDFQILDSVTRTEDSINNAFSDIQQSQDQVNYALFWFAEANPFDKTAIEYLKQGDQQKAIEIWKKVTNNKEVTSKNFSSFNNLGTLKLISHFQADIQTGIDAKIKLIESDYFKNFVHAVANETYTIDNEKQIEKFIDELLIQFKNQYSSSETLQLFSNCNGSTQKYLSKKFTEEPLHNIESQIESSKKKRNQNKEEAYEFGLRLFVNSKDDLSLLRSLLGTNDLKYKMIADNLAKEIMQCGIDYFQKWKEKKDPSEEGLKLLKYAKSIAIGSQTKDRIKENTEGIQEWAETAPIKEDLAFITRKLKSFQNSMDTISNAKSLVNSCKSKLQNIRVVLGSNDEFYLNISSAVVSNALGMVIDVVNEAQSGLEYNKAKLIRLPDIVSDAVSVISTMGSLDMNSQTRHRYSENKSTINGINSQLESVRRQIHSTNGSSSSSSSNSGCYIATMAYGDYDHPQVIELRNFRDDFLSKTIVGRYFIKFYYKYSPSLVEKLKNKQSINLIIRKGLDQFIKTIKK
ncbi:CFI-box-CTERM domain-containing protein [Polaribacter butkevichii]|uniref:Uncharacterized protein n=1 Tax=Polaribacter butkevichii TaxID=218490 RepID=A0A2P6CCZ5_9FLAO|nr:CFI-box-CTERM domain-containing protein [Polaribacter butkevichii]PQJ72769.1 hypothetical protein BTO14_05635 [Polaribacter butkevichii]